MSNTRRTNDDSVLHQSRYASSPEFERGLLAGLVARRISVIDDKADREMIWFLEHLSHQEGGLARVAADLLSKYGDRIGTPTMIKTRRQAYSPEEIKKIRMELPGPLRRRFPLRGETKQDIAELEGETAFANYLFLSPDERHEQIAEEREWSATRPSSYPAAALLNLCQQAATNGFDDENDTDNLEKELCNLCLDPGWRFGAGRPWYFAGLIDTLRDYSRKLVETKAAGVVVTELGLKVHETLDYTLASKSMTLIEGDARTGKTYAARSWCEQHPGQARFVEVPTGNDDKSFFRALARGLGLGNFQQYKALEIRERVECVLLTGDVLLALDEGHRLWPEVNLTRGFPRRINWLMSMANQGVPICIISTPQFVERQIAARQFAGWNDAQFIGRLGHRERLPSALSVQDLVAVAKSVLPEADTATLRALAAYARTSARYLAAIDSITKRARYIAGRAGHVQVMTDDVRKAMTESVIPSDTMLVRALEKTKSRRRATLPTPEAPLPAPAAETFENRNPRNDPLRNGSTNRIADLVEH